MGALSLSLPVEVRSQRVRLIVFVSLFNLGRIISYAAAGVVAGAFGVELLKALGLDNAHEVLRIVAVIFMVSIGFYLAGWFPQMAQVERIGQPIWHKLEPIARKMMPINTHSKAFVYGALWGWLPCGMVYMVLLMTVASGSPTNGAFMMLAFGVGTLPTMLSAGIMASWIRRFASSARTRQVIGLLIIVMALASLFVGGGEGHHHHH